MKDPQLRFLTALGEFGRRLDAVPPGAWGDPTPCDGWSVRDLVEHVVEETCWARSALVPGSGEDPRPGEDPTTRWHEAAAALSDALSTTDVLDREVDVSSGSATARDVLPELTVDHLVHAWDLARATDGDTQLDPDLVDACAAWFDDHEHAWRTAGEIGPGLDVPSDAGSQQVLLARFGRDDGPRTNDRPATDHGGTR